MKKTYNAITGKGSPLSKYQDIMVGSRSFAAFLYYEWCQLLGPVPGALGMILRKLFWPAMFASCGKGSVAGASALLTRSVAAYTISLGTPARVIKKRTPRKTMGEV